MSEGDAVRQPATPLGWRRAAAAGLTFRPITDDDFPFLAALYASTRSQELSVVAWSEEEKAAFCNAQFQAQHAHYLKTYAGADWLLIQRNGEAIGRVYIVRWAREHRIIDIAFMPAHCGQGLGSALLRDLMEEAAAQGKSVSIHVERFNPALRLYCRLGFTKADEHGVYDLMQWKAAGEANVL